MAKDRTGDADDVVGVERVKTGVPITGPATKPR
jgi:hypothetical protein